MAPLGSVNSEPNLAFQSDPLTVQSYRYDASTGALVLTATTALKKVPSTSAEFVDASWVVRGKVATQYLIQNGDRQGSGAWLTATPLKQ